MQLRIDYKLLDSAKEEYGYKLIPIMICLVRHLQCQGRYFTYIYRIYFWYFHIHSKFLLDIDSLEVEQVSTLSLRLASSFQAVGILSYIINEKSYFQMV